MNGGRFRKGDDPRRHKFSREECKRGFQAACESLERRFPGCDVHFLMCAIIGSKPWNQTPIWQAAVAQYEQTGQLELALFISD